LAIFVGHPVVFDDVGVIGGEVLDHFRHEDGEVLHGLKVEAPPFNLRDQVHEALDERRVTVFDVFSQEKFVVFIHKLVQFEVIGVRLFV
jgi:hypothetical protein